MKKYHTVLCFTATSEGYVTRKFPICSSR